MTDFRIGPVTKIGDRKWSFDLFVNIGDAAEELFITRATFLRLRTGGGYLVHGPSLSPRWDGDGYIQLVEFPAVLRARLREALLERLGLTEEADEPS